MSLLKSVCSRVDEIFVLGLVIATENNGNSTMLCGMRYFPRFLILGGTNFNKVIQPKKKRKMNRKRQEKNQDTADKEKKKKDNQKRSNDATVALDDSTDKGYYRADLLITSKGDLKG